MPEAIAAHVNQCATCQRLLEDLTGDGPDSAARDPCPTRQDANLPGADRTEAFLRRLENNQPIAWRTLPDLPEPPDPSTLSPTRQVAAPGELPTLTGFEIVAELGRGGMGVVYQAWQLSPRRLVALKMLSAGVSARPEELARFRTEAEAVARPGSTARGM